MNNINSIADELSIVMVSYNSSHIITNSINNLINSNIKIYIVDNKSADDIETTLKENYSNSNITLVKLANNYGFSNATNVALKKIKTKYSLILNPDAIITLQSITNLIKEIEKDDNIALASPIPLNNYPTSNSLDNIDIDIKEQAIRNYIENNKIICNYNDNSIEVPFICGGYCLMKMDIFRKIGFFDENLFLYGEDEEISTRTIKFGYKNILVKDAFVIHYGQCSTKTRSVFEKLKYLFLRNYHQGWAKIYLKRSKENYLTLMIKAIFQLFVSFINLFTFKKFIAKFARAIGMIRNLFSLKNSTKKLVIIEKEIKI